MPVPMEMTNKIDITSTALEKGIDVAKDFIDRLVSPSIEELGLLLKDQVSLWRFSNQIRILNRAKSLCEKHNITTKAISPKLLCPYLENASLEDDVDLQEKWANLLVNMVDSNKNIQNHVFPYILSQLSKDEFLLLETLYKEKSQRVALLKTELDDFEKNRKSESLRLKKQSDDLSIEINGRLQAGEKSFSSDILSLRTKKQVVDNELARMGYKASLIKSRIEAPQAIPDGVLKTFEIENVVRLGVAKVEYETSAGTHRIEIPSRRESPYESNSVDLDIEVETSKSIILTELGELFLGACSESSA